MIDAKWEDNVFMMAKHKLLEAIEKRNKEPYHTEGDIRAYKDALKQFAKAQFTDKSNTN